MTDEFLADSHYAYRDFDVASPGPSIFLADPSDFDVYKRYQLTSNGISPRLYPGQSRHLVCADSDEHDEEGHITEDLSETVLAMAKKTTEQVARTEKGNRSTRGNPDRRTPIPSWWDGALPVGLSKKPSIS